MWTDLDQVLMIGAIWISQALIHIWLTCPKLYGTGEGVLHFVLMDHVLSFCVEHSLPHQLTLSWAGASGQGGPGQ